MPNTGSNSTPMTEAPDGGVHGVNGSAILLMIGGFLLAALLAMLCWFWYAGRHAISATPQHGPTGVGGMTAGDKGGKKQ